MKTLSAASGLLLLCMAACQQPEDHAETMLKDTPSDGAAAAGWVDLTPEYWRAYRSEGLPEAWVATDDGSLQFVAEGEGGDIVTVDQYDNFELELEWKLSPAGNSGIMFRVSEDHDYPWRTGPEFQILDDAQHPDAQEGDDRLAGANYDMHAPAKNVVHPVGEWNHVRILVTGAQVEHWMNGEMIVSYVLWSDDWKERIKTSKWIDMPDYGMEESGHICLQDHGDPVWFRNIRIRRLATD